MSFTATLSLSPRICFIDNTQMVMFFIWAAADEFFILEHQLKKNLLLPWLQLSQSPIISIHVIFTITVTSTPILSVNLTKLLSLLFQFLGTDTQFLLSIKMPLSASKLPLPPILLLLLRLLQQQEPPPRIISKTHFEPVDFWPTKSSKSSNSSKILDIYRSWNLGRCGFA